VSPRLVIEIGRTAGDWTRAFPGLEDLLRRAARTAWRAAGSGEAAVLSILLADAAFVRARNRDYRGQDKPTNVLAFPMVYDGPPVRPRMLGDIVFALEVLEEEAAAQSKTPADHLSHLTVHGVLHLLGHDHETETQATAMEALETEILRGLGIADPYAAKGEPVG
jgi:probable rRNA maturation factor